MTQVAKLESLRACSLPCAVERANFPPCTSSRLTDARTRESAEQATGGA